MIFFVSFSSFFLPPILRFFSAVIRFPRLPSGRKKRHSIANDNPKALEEAVNDPFIHEVVDLFGGSVVDIHR